MLKIIKSRFNILKAALIKKWGRGRVAITDISNVIAQIEGWNVSGSLAQRNNNPGNLRFVGQQGAILGENGFAKFQTPEAGFDALNKQISLDASRGLDVSGFLSKYAPSSENDTNNYIAVFTKSLGVNPTDKLSDILGAGVNISSSVDDSGAPVDGSINTVLVVSVGLGLGWMLISSMRG